MKKVYLWAFKTEHKFWSISSCFYENEKELREELREEFGNISDKCQIKRLDYTMIEVDE